MTETTKGPSASRQAGEVTATAIAVAEIKQLLEQQMEMHPAFHCGAERKDR